MRRKSRSKSSGIIACLKSRRFLRKRLIGKHVHVLVDYVKPKDGEYDERECVTVTYGSQNTSVVRAMALVEL